MADFTLTYPCGYQETIENVPYIYGRKHNGRRPIQLDIQGRLPTRLDPLLSPYEMFTKLLHPHQGKITHNGNIVKEWVIKPVLA